MYLYRESCQGWKQLKGRPSKCPLESFVEKHEEAFFSGVGKSGEEPLSM